MNNLKEKKIFSRMGFVGWSLFLAACGSSLPIKNLELLDSKKIERCQSIEKVCTMNYDPFECVLSSKPPILSSGSNECVALESLRKEACLKGIQVMDNLIECNRIDVSGYNPPSQ